MARLPQLRSGCFEALDSASAYFRIREVEKDELVLSKGSPGDSLFFILEGTFEAHLDDGKTATMTECDFFGEIGLLLGVERTSSVTALTDGRLLVLPGEHLSRTIKCFPQLRKALEDKVQTRAPQLMARLKGVAPKL